MSTLFFGQELVPMERNPLILRYGRTEGKKCKECKHLVSHKRSRRWYKCLMRGVSNGPGTDHGCTWNACGLYEEDRL